MDDVIGSLRSELSKQTAMAMQEEETAAEDIERLDELLEARTVELETSTREKNRLAAELAEQAALDTKDEIQEMEKRLDNVTAAKSRRSIECKALAEELNSFRSQASTEASAAESAQLLQEELAGRMVEVQESMEESAQLQDELTASREGMDALRSQLAAHAKIAIQSKEAAKEHVQDLEEELDKVVKVKSRRSEQVKRLDNTVGNLRSEMSVKESLAAQELVAATEKVRRLEQELEARSQGGGAAEERTGALHERVAAAEKNVADVDVKLRSAEERNLQLEQELKPLRTRSPMLPRHFLLGIPRASQAGQRHKT